MKPNNSLRPTAIPLCGGSAAKLRPMCSNQDALGYWTLGSQFLRLTETACAEIASRHNPHFVISNQPLSPSTYDDMVRWSDHTVGTAVLFNFFHGIELVIKGFLAANGSQQNHHRLTELLGTFDNLLPNTELSKLLGWAFPAPSRDTPITRFLATNGIKIDDWFQALKYPMSTQGQSYSHLDLKYGGESTTPFWEDVGQLSAKIRSETVALAKSQGYA